MLILEAQPRGMKQKPAQVRRTGLIPAVFYGYKEKATSIALQKKDFLKVWKSAGESSIITLKHDGEEKTVLIQDVARDPVSGEPIHADFYVIEKDKKLKIKIPIEFTGVAPAVKDLGGILVKVMHEVEVESLPANLPHNVAVDISSLTDMKSQILAKDIKLPKGVELITGGSEVVVAIAEPKAEEEKPAEPIDLASIEVEKKGKEATEGEEATAETSGEEKRAPGK